MSEEYFKQPKKQKPIPSEERKLRMTTVAKITKLISKLTTDELIAAYTYMVNLSNKTNTQP